MIIERKVVEMALDTLVELEKLMPVGISLMVINSLRDGLGQGNRKCEAGPSLQDLWDCWDAAHGGQEPVVWIRESDLKLLNGDLDCCLVSATRDFTDRVPLYLHPASEWYWELVYADSCLDYIRENYPKIYQECGGDTEGSRKAMLRAAAPKYEEQSK